MSTVAEQLHMAREMRKLTIPQAAEVTKIRTDHLRALEDGNYDVFPAPVYIRGFVRSYAQMLKLDVPQIMSDLDAELGRSTKFSTPPPLSVHPKGAVDFAMLQLSRLSPRNGLILVGVVGGILLILIVALLWHGHKRTDPLAGLPPAVYKPATGSGNTLPLSKPAPARQ